MLDHVEDNQAINMYELIVQFHTDVQQSDELLENKNFHCKIKIKFKIRNEGAFKFLLEK